MFDNVMIDDADVRYDDPFHMYMMINIGYYHY